LTLHLQVHVTQQQQVLLLLLLPPLLLPPLHSSCTCRQVCVPAWQLLCLPTNRHRVQLG
jgi:hypothetical protein